MLHPAIGEARPYPGVRSHARASRGSSSPAARSGTPASPRNLQDPLTFRNLPQIQGACRDVLGHVDGAARDRAERVAGQPDRRARRGPGHLGRELRDPAARRRPRLPPDRPRDRARALAPSASSSCLDTPWSGLPTGLAPDGGHGRRRLDVPEPRRPESGGGSPPPRPARLVRADLDRPRRGDRGPDDDGAAGGAPARGDGRASAARSPRSSWRSAPRRPSSRGHRPGARNRAGGRRRPRATCRISTIGDHVPDVHGLAAAVRDGDVARAAFGGGGAAQDPGGMADDDRA